MPEAFHIRPIEPRDDPVVASIIRTTLTEFGCTAEGFALHDEEVDRMAVAYGRPRHRYYVVEMGGAVTGCGGYAPLAGICEHEPPTAELRKMYFKPELRGLGAGRSLLAQLLDEMRADGFLRCYIETATGMDQAQALYRKLGFDEIQGPLGQTGHAGACDRYFARSL